MVLIVSDDRDVSTNQIIDWVSLSKNFYVLRDAHSIEQKLSLDDNNTSVLINDIDLDQVKSFWYRRGLLSSASKFLNDYSDISYDKSYINDIKKSVKLDLDRLDQHLHLHFLNSDKITLGNYLRSGVNKINTLCTAKASGLSIPKTIVTNSKEDLKEAFGKQDFITKPIGEASVYYEERDHCETQAYNYTSLVNLSDLEEKFQLSLFQEKIEKRFEIRAFVLNKEIYSMAIFSQRNDQTKVDFRNYDHEIPNRSVPYKLPEKIEQEILVFMEKMALDSGSIDFLVTTENKFVFLEINPVGQFGMVSYPCNYNIDKKIAEYLTNF